MQTIGTTQTEQLRAMLDTVARKHHGFQHRGSDCQNEDIRLELGHSGRGWHTQPQRSEWFSLRASDTGPLLCQFAEPPVNRQ